MTKIHYFTEKLFKGAGMTYYFELQCRRLVEGDTRLASFYTKYSKLGNIYTVESPKPYDLAWEKEEIMLKEIQFSRPRCPVRVVVVEDTKEGLMR